MSALLLRHMSSGGYASAKRAEEIADVRDDGLRFFPGREVSATGVMPLLLEVVVALDSASRRHAQSS